MTQAQKIAKAKFKQAIAYRTKTGVSLKEAFAHIYGKKVGVVKKKAAPKKKAAKKVVGKIEFLNVPAFKGKELESMKKGFAEYINEKRKRESKKKIVKKKAVKKVAKKRIAGPKDSAMVKKELAKKGLKMPHGYATIKRKRKISGVKKKKITETGILNRIHKVKKDVDKLDEAQHKHMMGAVNKLTLRKYEENLNNINKVQNHIAEYTKMSKNMAYNLDNRKSFKLTAMKYKRYLTELKQHAKELKKLI